MTKNLFPVALAFVAACGGARDPVVLEASTSDGSAPTLTLPRLANEAVDPDEEIASAAIDSLRAAGPEGLAALMEAHADAITRLRQEPLIADATALDALREDAELARLRHAIDHVAAQRDAFASGLYWYTDLAEAQIEASRSGRPILSLRMLGRLDEEASCANSRFFRWLLYPSPLVREALAGYVLHWSSERPAPHVTIDMGDGRTIERTITGNSIHYVLDASGNVIDAIAGLHTADDFAARLREAQAIAAQCGVREADRSCLAREHQRLLDATQAEWTQLTGLEDLSAPTWDALVAMDPPAPPVPSAEVAMQITASKMFIERPMLRLFGAGTPPAPTPIAWDSIALMAFSPRFADVMSPPSCSLARLKTGRVDDTAMLDVTFARARTDTVMNRFTLDRRIHAWLASSDANDFATLNTRVYAQLFLTPASDPWLGLRSESDWDVLETTGSTDGEN